MQTQHRSLNQGRSEVSPDLPKTIGDRAQKCLNEWLETLGKELIAKRAGEDALINVYTATINMEEGRSLEILHVRAFIKALAQKSGQTRATIFQARYILGYTIQDIAGELGMTKGSVRHHLEASVRFFETYHHRQPSPAATAFSMSDNRS